MEINKIQKKRHRGLEVHANYSFFLFVCLLPSCYGDKYQTPDECNAESFECEREKKTHNNLEDMLRATQIPALCNTTLKCYSPCLHSSVLQGRKNGEMEGRLCV